MERAVDPGFEGVAGVGEERGEEMSASAETE
jgi:hypothetical protein